MTETSRKLAAANEKLAGMMHRPKTYMEADPEAVESAAEVDSRPLIALAVIYGNEQDVIRRFIQSFAPAVDVFVFVRAVGCQSPDKTFDIITDDQHDLKNTGGKTWIIRREEYLNAEGAKDWPHVDNFGAARQKAWDLAAATGAKYLMWADCDDTLAPGAAEAIRAACSAPDAKDVLIAPYHVYGCDAQIVMRERLARNDGCSRWIYPLHEQLTFSRPVTYHLIREGVFLHQPPPARGGRSVRNATILEGQLAGAPRNLFYLAKEMLSLGKLDQFRQIAASALALSGLEAELRYDLYLDLAQTETGPKAKEWAALAYGVLPDRREAVGLLAGYALLEGRNREAMAFGNLLANLEEPNPGRYWTVNRQWYGWKGEDMIARCMRANGNEAGAEARLLKNAGPGGFTFSIIHATLWRGPQAETIRAIWLSRARHPEKVDYCFGFHECDADTRRFLGSYKHSVCPSPDGKPQSAIANGDCATAIATGKILIGAQDDVIPPDGWDELLLERMRAAVVSAGLAVPQTGDFLNYSLFIATSDGIRSDGLCVNPMMSRAYQQQKRADCEGTGMGHHGPNGYHSMYWDNEITFRAKADAAAGRCVWVDATDVVFVHNHPSANKAIPIDATYAEQNKPEHYESGRKLFLERNPTAKLT